MQTSKIPRLSSTSLPETSENVSVFDYDRTKTQTGVLHFGIGNFHRAHQAIYCDDLLCDGETDWAITGVSMRSPGVYDALSSQEFLYTQVTLGPDVRYRIVGAVRNVLTAWSEPQAVIDAVADSSTKVVTTTVTEKGYVIAEPGGIDLDNDAVRSDFESLQHPQTLYGFLAAGIIQRRRTGGEPMTIICCDNIHSGGALLQSGVEQLLAAHCEDTRTWAESHVGFVSSMVDRITPATDDSLRTKLADELGVVDHWPVAAEPFSEWIIQDNFAGPRPPFDRVGAKFVDDILPYERLKLQFFNAGHSVAAVLGYLTDCYFIHEALERPPILNFIRQLLLTSACPEAGLPNGLDVEIYIEKSLQRYSNKELGYTVEQVCSDSSKKIQQRWVPKIDDAIKYQSDTRFLAFSVAAWVTYVEYALKRKQLHDEDLEKLLTMDSAAGRLSILAALKGPAGNEYDFTRDMPFMASIQTYHDSIARRGIETAIEEMLNTTKIPAQRSTKHHA